MPPLIFRLTCAAVLYVCGAAAAEDLTDAELAARDYSYEGVGIGTSLNDFLKQFPSAKSQESGKSNVTAMYVRMGRNGPMLRVEIFQQQIYYIGVTFGPQILSRHGGRDALESKLTATLGLPNTVRDNMSYWRFPKVHRKVGYRQGLDGSSTLLIIDTLVDKQRRERQVEDLDIGF